MKFEYTGRHLDVTPALRSHVENHFDKIKHLFDGDGTKAHVIIEVEKGRHRAEIILKWRDQVLTATSTVSDMYQSLTQSIDKIEKQVLKLKDKVKDKHQKAKKVTTVAEPVDEVKVENGSAPQILDVENYVVKPMTAEEAALNIDGGEKQFVVFRDAENEKISVVYKRKDGNYGLIQP
jgi:putative sigma-54 modulation protein